MIKNFAKDSAEFVKNGAPMCSEEEFKERMDICRACPELTDEDKCGLCGCYMPVKAGWKTTECADDPRRWSKLIDDDKGRAAMEDFANLEQGKNAVNNPQDFLKISGKSKATQADERREHIRKMKRRPQG
tara:strand:- start:10196 stop:10585 length:390 start_codon:yes stop_codon:yes gene_type:complete